MIAPPAKYPDGKQSASNRTPRQINRNLLFHQILTNQPISRVDLARSCGLQRSTVSLIVEELLHNHWIVEGAAESSARGRKPTALMVNSRRRVIALDVHPARTTLAIADLSGSIFAQSEIPLPTDPGKVLNAIGSAIRRAIAEQGNCPVEGIGITVPGRFSHQVERTIFAPNVAWPISRIKSRVENSTGLPVFVDNVANACALSEVWFAQNQSARDLVVLNVSEGLGSGIWAAGRLLRGHAEGAGEFGHVQLDPEGIHCGCGSRGCWETIASNRAAMRYYSESAGKPAPGFEEILQLAEANDRYARAAIEKMCKALGSGMHMIVSVLAPSEIVVVGEITRLWSVAFPIIEAELRRFPLIHLPRVRIAAKPETARLRGAVALVTAQRAI